MQLKENQYSSHDNNSCLKIGYLKKKNFAHSDLETEGKKMYVDSITEPLSFLMLKHVVLFYDQRKKKGDKRRETAAFFRAALLEILMTGLTDLLPPLFHM